MAMSARTSWGDIPGLLPHVLWSGVAAHAPLPLALLGLKWLFTRRVGIVATAVILASTLAVQYGAHALVSSLGVVPVQKRTARIVEWLLDHRDRVPAGVVEVAEMFHRELARMHGGLGPARRALLSRTHHRSITLHTPDGCVLDGVVVGHPDAAHPGNRGCIVYLGGNGEHYELNQLLHTWHERGFVVVAVNPRGLGDSTGSTTRHGLVIDAACTIDFAHRVMGFPRSRIVVFGHSLGGGIGAEAVRFFPQATVINDRSFGAISRVALYHVAERVVQVLGPDDWRVKALKGALAFLVRYVACFELDTVSNWRRLTANPRIIVHTEQDGVIPPPTQLHTMLAEAGLSPADMGCVLPLEILFTRGDGHNRMLTANENRRLFAAVDRVLAGQPLPAMA